MSDTVLLEVSPPYRSPKTRPIHKSAYSDAVEMQRVLKADVLDPTADRRERAQAALAWERLEERKRILKMRGLPKSIDTTKQVRGRRSVQAPAISEPTETGPGST